MIDHVIAPDLTLRQWVLTVPFELRLLLAAKPEALSAIGLIFIQEIQRWQREQARALGYERPETAAVSFCQRFGSDLNLNIHWHVIVPDAVFLPDAGGERVDTLKHRAPTRLDLEEIVTTVAIRAIRWLERHGYLRSDDDEDLTENADTASPWMRCLQGSMGVGDLRRWAEHGSAQQSRGTARGRSLPKPTKGLNAEHLKFNLHAGVSVPGGLPAARERLLRYCARPPLALERLSIVDDGKICYRIKDTDQVRLMTPVQFLARLAALVPPPRHPLVRFYGVWAPHSQWRTRVVTAPPAKKTRVTCAASIGTNSCATSVTPAGLSSADVLRGWRGRRGAAGRPGQVRSTSFEREATAPIRRGPASRRCRTACLVARRRRGIAVQHFSPGARSELRRRDLPEQPPPLSRARSPDWVD